MMANAVCRQPILMTQSTPSTSAHIPSLHPARASITYFSPVARSSVFLSAYVHTKVVINVQHK
jgi:hypothetical protein